MATLNEMLQKYVNLPYEDLLKIAEHNLHELSSILNKNFSDSSITSKFLVILTCACLDTDGEISDLEISFVNDLLETDFTRDSIRQLVKDFGTDECRDLVDQIADSLDSNGKATLISLCLCFLSIDETITRKEVAFITKLIG